MDNSTEVGSLHYDLNIDDTNLKSQLNDSDKAVTNFGDRVNTVGEQMQAGFREAAKVLAVVSAGLTLFAKNATDTTVELVKQSKNLGREIGVTTTEASRLVAAFGHMGVSADEAQQMFGIFSKKIQAATDATDGNRLAAEKLQIDMDKTKTSISNVTTEIQKNGDKSGELHLQLRELNNTLQQQQIQLDQNADSFMKLGISTTDANGNQKSFNTLLFEVADRFKTMPDGIQKTTIAMDLFGRQGKDMIKVLNLGGQGIQDLEAQADKLGLTLNPTTINSVAKLIASQKLLKEQTDALKISVGTATTPVLTTFNTEINKVLQSVMKLHDPFKTAAIDILAFGGPVAGAISAFAAFAGNIASTGASIAKLAIGLGEITIIVAVLGVVVYECYTHWDSLKVKLMEVYNTIYTFIKPAIDLLVMAAGWLLTGLKAIWAAVSQNLLPALEQLWSSFVRLYNALQPALTDVLKILGAAILGVLIMSLWLVIGALNVLVQVFSIVVSAVSLVVGWFSNLLGWIGNLVAGVINLVATIGSWFGNLPGYVASAITAVISWFRAMPGNIISAVGNLASTLYDAGRDLVQGMINGITDKFKDLSGSVKKAVGNAVSTVKSFLGIHSPSTVFMDIGRNVTQGFVRGINDTSHLAIAAMGNLGNNIIAPNLNITGAGTGGNNTNTRFGDTIVHIDQINNRQDADYLINRLDTNQRLQQRGVSPA